MDDAIRHLLWGVLLFTVYVIICAYDLAYLHLCGSLKPSQTLALLFVGETVTLLPFSTIIWKHWTLHKPKEWLAFGTLGFLQGAFHAIVAFCANIMKLGELDR